MLRPFSGIFVPEQPMHTLGTKILWLQPPKEPCRSKKKSKRERKVRKELSVSLANPNVLE